MELKGVYVGLNTSNGYQYAVFRVTGTEGLEKLIGLPLDIELKEHKDKRSLNANAYFHLMVSKIAKEIGASNNEVKNRLIRDYGQYEYIDGNIPTYLIRAEFEEAVMSKEGIHFQKLANVHMDGQDYIKVAAMRGSHTYNTEEMSRLIDGTVQEAKDLGIETMPPDMLERMIKAWRSHL